MKKEDQHLKKASLIIKSKKPKNCKDVASHTDLTFEPYEGMKIVTDYYGDSINADVMVKSYSRKILMMMIIILAVTSLRKLTK